MKVKGVDSFLSMKTSARDVGRQGPTEIRSQITWIKILLFPFAANFFTSLNFSFLPRNAGIIAKTLLSCW